MATACINNVSLFVSGSDPTITNADPGPDPKSDPKDFIDFEFSLNSPVAMLPADELFSDGKLVPLQLAPIKAVPDPDPATEETHIRLPDTPLKAARREELIGSGSDSFAVSPKAPTCSIRWRELLRLKQQQKKQQQQQGKADPGPCSRNPNPRSLKHFLNRKSSDLNVPLLKEPEPESEPESEPEPEPEPVQLPVSVSSRLSLSSGPEPAPAPALAPDNDAENKPNRNPILLSRNPPKVRVLKSRAVRTTARPAADTAGSVPPPTMIAAADSPRMNASGKVVFQGLGRSSSSPSTFNGGTRVRYRGMERSFSANVRVTNVPVCSLRSGSKSFGFGQLFSGSGSGGGAVTKNGSNIKGKN